jgi:hypothetical protein
MKTERYFGLKNSTEKKKILSIEREVTNKIIRIKVNMYGIGKLLTEAKGILPHGNFKDWIQETFANDLPYSTANFYMRVYKNFRGKKDLIKYFPSEMLLMLTQNQFPDTAFKIITNEVDENPHKLPPNQRKIIKQLYDENKNGGLTENEFAEEVDKVLEFSEEEIEDQKQKTHIRIARNGRRSMYFGIKKLTENIGKWRKKVHDMEFRHPYNPNDPTHEDVIDEIDTTIHELQRLRNSLEGDDALLRKQFTENGEEWVARKTG